MRIVKGVGQQQLRNLNSWQELERRADVANEYALKILALCRQSSTVVFLCPSTSYGMLCYFPQLWASRQLPMPLATSTMCSNEARTENPLWLPRLAHFSFFILKFGLFESP